MFKLIVVFAKIHPSNETAKLFSSGVELMSFSSRCSSREKTPILSSSENICVDFSARLQTNIEMPCSIGPYLKLHS